MWLRASEPRAAARVREGTRGPGGCGGAAGGGCCAAVGAEWRAGSPRGPPCPPCLPAPALPGSPVALVRAPGALGTAAPSDARMGRGGRTAALRRSRGRPAGAEGGGSGRVGDLSGAGQLVGKGNRSARFLLWGRRQVVVVVGVWAEHSSRRSGMTQNEAEVRDQARAEDVRNG